MSEEKDKKQVASVIDREDYRELRRLAFEKEVSVSRYLRDLIAKHLKSKKGKKNEK